MVRGGHVSGQGRYTQARGSRHGSYQRDRGKKIDLANNSQMKMFLGRRRPACHQGIGGEPLRGNITYSHGGTVGDQYCNSEARYTN